MGQMISFQRAGKRRLIRRSLRDGSSKQNLGQCGQKETRDGSMVENDARWRSAAGVSVPIERFAIGIGLERRNGSSDWIECSSEESVK